jgi:large subunit ribosomal protein L10
MAITKQKKVEIVANATQILKGAVSGVFVGFNKLTVAEVNEMRNALRADGVKYTVVKKTLLKRALADINTTGELPDLPGEVAMAVLPAGMGDDVTAPARGVQAFVKKFKEKLTFLGGVIGGVYLSQAETKVVATIPPTPVLRGMFANVINSPLQRFAIALSEVSKTKGA